MRLKQIFKYYWVIMLTILALAFWLGFSVTEQFVNRNNCYYSVTFYSTEIDKEEITADFFLDALRKVDKEGNVSYSYATVKPNDFFDSNDIEILNDSLSIEIKINAHYFIGNDESSISEKSLDRFNKVMKKVLTYHDEGVLIDSVETVGYTNPFLVAFFSVVGGFIVFIVAMYLLRNKLPVPNDEAYKNGNIYRYPISKEYWRKAVKEVRGMKVFDMCMISILFALQIVMKFISIPSGFPGLNIVLNYLIFALIALIYGPLWGLIIGFGSDVLGFIMNPTSFHIGYTIQAMLTGFVYGLCFYKTELKFSKVLICRILVNIVLNGIVGSFLMGDYYGWGFEASIMYMVGVSLPKNIIYLIPQSILLFVFLRATVALPIKKGMVPKETLSTKNKGL